LFIQHKILHNEAGLDGNVYRTQVRAALTAVTDRSEAYHSWLFQWRSESSILSFPRVGM